MSKRRLAEEAALLRDGWTEARAFQIEQKLLGCQAAAESGKGAVGGDDAVAGNDDRDGIVVVGLADSTGCERRADFGGKPRVRPRLAVGDPQ